MEKEDQYNPNSKNVHDFWRENFNKLNKSCVMWLLNAQELKLSSDIIYKEFSEATDMHFNRVKKDESIEYDQRMGLGSVWMMLCSYSIESLLKGMYFAVNKKNIENGNLIIDWKGSGHDLLVLFDLYNEKCKENFKVSLSDQELFYLKRISEFANWAGKYPVPKKYSRHIPVESPGGGYSPLTIISVDQDKKLFDKIYRYLDDIFEKLLESNRNI
jgi:hypothetical protein